MTVRDGTAGFTALVQSASSTAGCALCRPSLAENPANLPYHPPYPGAPPRASQQGHEELIRDLREKLTDREKKYKDDCEDSDPPTPTPPLEPVCGENCKRVLKAVRDTVTGAIIFTFVLVCATS